MQCEESPPESTATMPVKEAVLKAVSSPTLSANVPNRKQKMKERGIRSFKSLTTESVNNRVGAA